MFLRYFLAVILLGNSAAHADLYRCVSTKGQVTFRDVSLEGETCTRMELSDKNKSSAPPQPGKPGDGKNTFGATPDVMLMCEENHFTDFRVFASPPDNWTKAQRQLFDQMVKQNESATRPYFAVKYVKGKLSYNQSGNEFLVNETPGDPNTLGWLGKIDIKQDLILLELKNINQKTPRMRSVLSVDRYTGLYKKSFFSPDTGELEYESTGKCKSYSEKLF